MIPSSVTLQKILFECKLKALRKFLMCIYLASLPQTLLFWLFKSCLCFTHTLLQLVRVEHSGSFDCTLCLSTLEPMPLTLKILIFEDSFWQTLNALRKLVSSIALFEKTSETVHQDLDKVLVCCKARRINPFTH